jgi:hypothetical protein
MKLLNALASSMVAVSLLVSPVALATEHMKKGATGTIRHDMDAFMKSCDMDHDGMVTKAEMLAHMEKMFDKMDTKKTGKLDKKQTEFFLKQLTAPSGA